MSCPRIDWDLIAAAVGLAVLGTYLLAGAMGRLSDRLLATVWPPTRTADGRRIERETAALQAQVGSNPPPTHAKPPAPPPPPPVDADLDPKVRATIVQLAQRTARRDFEEHKRPRANPYAAHSRKAAIWAIEYQITWLDCEERAAKAAQAKQLPATGA